MIRVNSNEFIRHFPDRKPPANAVTGRFEGIITAMLRKYADHEIDDHAREKLEKYLVKHTCPDCNGARLKAESRMITVAGEALTELSQKSLDELKGWMKILPAGYRLFTQEHLNQVRLVRLIFKCTMLGHEIKRNAYDIIHACAGACYEEALESAERMEAFG